MTIKYKLTTIFCLICVLVITSIDPIYPTEQFLQHIGTFLLGVILISDLRMNFLSTASFCGVAFFTLIHIIGARYIYSYVPYNEWSISITGFDLNAFLDTKRNHYDRFVHFSFGLVMIPICIQIVELMKLRSKVATIFMAWLMIQTGSMIYELFEWLLTIIVSSEAANNYNGQQGDMWDAQKDMALAFVGSTISTLFALAFRKKTEKYSF